MPEYISKSDAYNAIKHEADTHDLPAYKEAYERSARIIDQMRPVKIPPKKMGRWLEFSCELSTIIGDISESIEVYICHARCSECKSFSYNITQWTKDMTPFCPKCGCTMK